MPGFAVFVNEQINKEIIFTVCFTYFFYRYSGVIYLWSCFSNVVSIDQQLKIGIIHSNKPVEWLNVVDLCK